MVTRGGGERRLQLTGERSRGQISRVVCSRLDLVQTQSTGLMSTLALSNDRMSKRTSSSFSGLDPPQKNSVVRDAPEGHVGIHGLLPQAVLKPSVHVDVPGLGGH